MLVTYYVIYIFLLFLTVSSCSRATIAIHPDNDQNLISCVTGIMKLYFKDKMITYVDINYDSNEIIRIINSLPATIISRNTGKNLHTSNVEYIITAGTSADFTSNFPNLMKEPRWNPYAKFLIIIKSLQARQVRHVFDKLLKYHVNNVVLVNGTSDVDLFTYNPFDNFNCGKKYDEIIEYGNCLTTSVKDFYPNKLVTGIRNCTFLATMAHWPPFSIDPAESDGMSGVEQYVFSIIGKLEQFDVNYTVSYDGEEFSTVAHDMLASGNLLMLQAQQTDVIFGGMLLTYPRADAFNYLSGHLPYTDEIRYFVQKAHQVSRLKSLLLEFDPTVWGVLLICFLCYFILLVVILKAKDKGSVFFVMIDLLFLHGSNMVSKSRGVFIFFVIFAYLINTYYQSALVSIMANPIKMYQIHSIQDLENYNVQPCISTGVYKFLQVSQKVNVPEAHEKGCKHLLESMQTVSRTKNKYTVSINSIYKYNKFLLYNEQGQELLYEFKQPVHKVIYAIYLYKGFPLHEKLNSHTTRMREIGLIESKLRRLYFKRELQIKRFSSDENHNTLRLIYSWYMLLTGLSIATGSFIVELFVKHKSARKAILIQTHNKS